MPATRGVVRDINGKQPGAGGAVVITAADVAYDNAASGLTADNAQGAIDELARQASVTGIDGKTLATTDLYTVPTGKQT